jgi:imidazolonepropionase-like amidohydrolase
MKNIVVFAVSLFACTLTVAQDLVIKNARIIDGTGQVIEQGSVVVGDGKIVSVSEGDGSGGGEQIDAGGMTLMPGFIDAHRHIMEGDPESWMKDQASARMQEYLDAGFTTVLSAGDSVPHIVELRRQLDEGEIDGPRLIVSGIVPMAQGGAFPRGTDPARLAVTGLLPQPAEAPEGVPAEQIRAMVQGHAEAGVDAIKTIFMGMPGGIEEQALTVIVDEAEKQGIMSITHAVTVADMDAAVRAGTHVLVHTPTFGQVGEESARLAADSGIPMMSTLGVFVPTFAEDNSLVRTRSGDDDVPRFRDLEPFPEGGVGILAGGVGPVNARLLWDAGVVIGYGTDTRFLPADSLKHELKALALFFPRTDIVTIMTRNAAASVLRSDEIGTLEPGKMADMVILDGDPLTDIEDLLNVSVVIKGGEVVVDKR